MLKPIAEGSVQGSEAILAVSVGLHHAIPSNWMFAANLVTSPVKAAQHCALREALTAAGIVLHLCIPAGVIAAGLHWALALPGIACPGPLWQ